MTLRITEREFGSGAICRATGNHLLDKNACVGGESHLICQLGPNGKQSGDSQTGTTNSAELH